MHLKQLSALCCTVLCLTGSTTALAANETTQAATSAVLDSGNTIVPASAPPIAPTPSAPLSPVAATDQSDDSSDSSDSSASSTSSATFDRSDTADVADSARDWDDLDESDDSAEKATADTAPLAEAGPAYVEPSTIVVSSHKVQVNGVPAVPQAYTIDRYNYFKLRDIAYLLNDTAVSFDLDWDNDTRTIDILPHASYTTVGGEMEISPGKSLKTLPSTATVTMNGEQVAIKGYSINGNNYYKIADLAKTIGFQALFDNDTRTVHIVTPEPDPEDPDTSSTVVPTTDPSDTIADPNVSIDGEKPTGETPHQPKPDDTDDPENPKPDDGKTDPEKIDPDSSIGFDNPIGSNQPTDPEGDPDSATTHKPAIDPELGDPEDSTPDDNKDDDPDPDSKPDDTDDENKDDDGKEDEEPTVPPRVSHLDGVRTVIIDAGHGGSDLGASHPTLDLDEKHINLYVAQYLKAYLETAGVKVIMVRDTLEEGAELSLRGTVMEENLETVDLFFGLHHNAANTEARGAQVLAQVADEDREDGPSRILAEELNKEYEKIGLTVRPIWFRHGDDGDYYYTNRKAASLQIVAVISEFCFIDNDEDILFIDSKIDLQTEAKGLSRAILRYFEQVEY